ncbi:MAG TPA: hypothetical protein VE758_02455, partial [Chthoniobacterales bacterium]|nr:hypothetical protein [Chthoniobacterales bacterium]
HHLEAARSFAQRTIELAEKVRMIEYVGMAKTNLAWCAWREGNYDEVEKLGSEALELWHGMKDPYSFDWMALLPMIAAAVERDQSEQAITLARGLFPENQHPIDDAVMSAFRLAIDLWDKTDQTAAAAQLQAALQTAEQLRYL